VASPPGAALCDVLQWPVGVQTALCGTLQIMDYKKSASCDTLQTMDYKKSAHCDALQTMDYNQSARCDGGFYSVGGGFYPCASLRLTQIAQFAVLGTTTF
jgi:hypothetical protein